MDKVGNKYLLNAAELGTLVNASITTATKVLHTPGYDPNDDALPYIVNRGHQLLYGTHIYSREQLDGCLVADKKSDRLIEDEGLYQAVKDAFGGCAVEVHAVYAPETNYYPGWLSAAVDLFRHGNTYRVFFSHDGNYQLRVEHLQEWRFG